MGNYTEVRAEIEKIKLDNVYAYFSIVLDEEELEHFKSLTKEQQHEYMYKFADLIVDSYDIDGYGDITKITIN